MFKYLSACISFSFGSEYHVLACIVFKAKASYCKQAKGPARLINCQKNCMLSEEPTRSCVKPHPIHRSLPSMLAPPLRFPRKPEQKRVDFHIFTPASGGCCCLNFSSRRALVFNSVLYGAVVRVF